MARLNHPNVVTIHDVGLQDGRPYLAMEYVQGQTLGQWRRERPRSVREILDVMAAVAQGLEAAHAAGIIHRDVKPDNVLVAGRRVLVTDFGLSVRADLARPAPWRARPLTWRPSSSRATPPPGRPTCSDSAVTLYELLYEQHPFDGGGEAPADLRARVLAGQVQPPPARPRVPRHVQRLMMAGLAVDPSARPASMGSLAAALLSAPARRVRRVGLGLAGGGGRGRGLPDRGPPGGRPGTALSGRRGRAGGRLERRTAGRSSAAAIRRWARPRPGHWSPSASTNTPAPGGTSTPRPAGPRSATGASRASCSICACPAWTATGPASPRCWNRCRRPAPVSWRRWRRPRCPPWPNVRSAIASSSSRCPPIRAAASGSPTSTACSRGPRPP